MQNQLEYFCPERNQGVDSLTSDTEFESDVKRLSFVNWFDSKFEVVLEADCCHEETESLIAFIVERFYEGFWVGFSEVFLYKGEDDDRFSFGNEVWLILD